MTKQSMPGSYKGGVKQWRQDFAKAFASWEEALAELQALGPPETHSRFLALSEVHLPLGLLHSWAGDHDPAQDHLRASAEHALAAVERALPRLAIDPFPTPDLARRTRDGAAAAALVGQDALAHTLFTYTERFAAGLVTGTEDWPPYLDDSVDFMGIIPLARAYSLLRLGRLDGFHALCFVDPPAEPDDSIDTWDTDLWGPITWAPADLHALLEAGEICWRLGKTWRGDDFRYTKWLFPLLRALTASLLDPASDPKRTAAQLALHKYYRTIRHMGDFYNIYLLVLDLQRAFPKIFTPVAPTPL